MSAEHRPREEEEARKTEVLIVDGHPTTRLGLRHLFGPEQDMQVVGECATGVDALSSLERTRPDLVVLGLDLAEEGGGVETLRKIKDCPRPPRVLVHAAHNFAEALSACILAGADSYLHKSVGLEELLDAGRRTAAGEKLWEVGQHVRLPKPPAEAVVSNGKRLSPREQEVLGLKLRRYTNAEIARSLYISVDTVKHHVTSIYRKLGKTRADHLF